MSTLQLKVTSCISPQQESQPVFEALKPDIGFSSLAMKALDGIFVQYEAIASILKICIRIWISFKKNNSYMLLPVMRINLYF